MKKTKMIATMGILLALSFVLSYVESLIPMSVGIPGVKIGLANLTTMVSLFTLGVVPAFVISFVRVILVSFTFGNMSMMLYSMCGVILSMLTMIILKRFDKFSIKGISVSGGVMHNVGQIIMAIIISETKEIITYLPVLLVSGVIFGAIIGILSERIVIITNRLEKN